MKLNLAKTLKILEQALDTLNYSIDVCNKIGTKNNYSYQELSEFEALTSRFARISDIVTQKLLKTIFIILKEETPTFLDRINLAEKLNMITSSSDLKQIRDIRNNITHEYLLDNLLDLYKEVLKMAPILLVNINKIKQYITEKKII
jgi:hypothetical protein